MNCSAIAAVKVSSLALGLLAEFQLITVDEFTHQLQINTRTGKSNDSKSSAV